MYERFYGLRERPFDLSSNPKYLLLTPRHEEALGNLEYGLAAANGITVLLGEAGTGKTTLVRRALAPYMQRESARPGRCVYVINPALSRREFFECLAQGFQLGPEAARSKTTLLRELERRLAAHGRDGFTGLLVIDGAQSLPYELLEEVRLLANIESETDKLLRVVLAGQPSLGTRLNEPGLHQLKQRIGLRCVLLPLTLHETATYIAHRLSLAGGTPGEIFTRDAVLAVHERARGIPRTINVICDNALLTGFATDQRPVGPGIVLEVCADFDLVGDVPAFGAAAECAPARSAPRAAVEADTRVALPPTLRYRQVRGR
jgi:type II secretory pathway predicted ATPase ExeA